ncbi:MAG: heavy-metal-associated domain-containing protein [Acidimicrobiia bacterium]
MATAIETTMQIEGFHCSGCANNLSRNLNSLEGVIKAEADFDSAKVEVRYDPDQITEDDLKHQIRATGFEPV